MEDEVKDSTENNDDNYNAQHLGSLTYNPGYGGYRTCPRCGYCPHCGRGGYHYGYPYYPYHPYYLESSWPVTYGSHTVSSNKEAWEKGSFGFGDNY